MVVLARRAGSGVSLASESVSPGEVLAVTGSLIFDVGDFGLRGEVRRDIVRNLRKTLGMRAARKRRGERVRNSGHRGLPFLFKHSSGWLAEKRDKR